jgi:hypothetical protein
MDRFTITAMLFLLACANPSLASNGETISKVKASIESMRIRENQPEIKITDEDLRRADPNQVLAVLAPYARDTVWGVRHTAAVYMVQIATIHPTTGIRQEVVRWLIDLVYSGNGHNEGPLLMGFTAKDFDDKARNTIRQALAKERVGILTVQLCGVANIQEELPRLETLLIDEAAYIADPSRRDFPMWYYTLGWRARLARARMGVKEDIARCIELAESERNATDRVLRVLPQIGYIRQPEAIEYLRKYLESSERLPPTNPGARGERYASRVMHILAESLEGYPVKPKLGGRYTDQEIEICRKWMADKANWKIIR